MKPMTTIVILSVIVLLMDDIRVKINHSPFCWWPPGTPSRTMGVPWSHFENHCSWGHGKWRQRDAVHQWLPLKCRKHHVVSSVLPVEKIGNIRTHPKVPLFEVRKNKKGNEEMVEKQKRTLPLYLWELFWASRRHTWPEYKWCWFVGFCCVGESNKIHYLYTHRECVSGFGSCVVSVCSLLCCPCSVKHLSVSTLVKNTKM